MLRLHHPASAHQPVGSAAIARTRLSHALAADRARPVALVAHDRVVQSNHHADEFLGRLLGESLPANGRNE
ncbi:MAG: hypothetical protein WCG26_04590 [Chloroflexales bacterium]